MNKIIIFLLSSLVLMSCLTSCRLQEDASSGEKTRDSTCEFRRDQCYSRVSIYSLIANPERYNEMPLVVLGYMGIDQQNVFLFPNVMSYEGRDAISSIQLLHDDFNDADHDALEERAGNYVAVYGEFSTEYDRNFYGARVGGLKLHGIPEYRGGRVPEETSQGIVRLIIRNLPELDEQQSGPDGNER